MVSERTKSLRQRAIELAKSGQGVQARVLLQQAVRLEPENETVWLWLASVAPTKAERLYCIQKLLQINPDNPLGLKVLQAMKLSLNDLHRQTLPVPPAFQESSVPIPDPHIIAVAQERAEEIVREYLSPPQPAINWTHKTRRRAGERDLLILRLIIAGVVLIVLIVITVVTALVVQGAPG